MGGAIIREGSWGMLRELLIQNLAIIEEARIVFGQGLNVLTGETGAGKSLLVAALELVLGERAKAEWIRSDAEEARVEAVIDLDDTPELSKILEDAGHAGAEMLVVRRTVARSGKNRIYVNDRAASLSFLETLGQRLADMHGQHEHQSLLRVKRHRELLDLFGDLVPARQKVAALYRSVCDLRKQLSRLEEQHQQMAAERDLAVFQHEEISRAKLREGEEEELEQERERSLHVERLLEACVEGEKRLYSDPESVLDALSGVQRRIEEAKQIDADLSRPAGLLETAQHYVEEAAQYLQRYASTVEGDPDRLEQIEERLGLVHRLKRKYHRSVEDLLALEQELATRIAQMESFEEDCSTLQEAIKQRESELLKRSRSLSEERKKVAKKLNKEIERELHAVGMKGTGFRVDVRSGPSDPPGKESEGICLEDHCIDTWGMDQIEFLIRTNPGQPFLPLQRIASGGELSRIMLAIRNVLRRSDLLPTLVFDEVDAGIGGAEAEAVGARLKRLSEDFQILCITHLPQIAVFGDTHLKVSKELEEGRTLFHIHAVEKAEREREIARMLGGIRITKKTLAHAREMLQEKAHREFP
jgi:DNA repair protein RecN (Recombination protein N)